MIGEYMLQLRAINKEYRAGSLRVHALRDVSLSLSRGEFVAVLGPSGCGKTTLLNIIGGLDRCDSGDLVVSGRSTRDFTERDMDAYRNHSVGFVFQNYNLISHQSVLANVELALALSGTSPARRRQKTEEALCRVGLGDQLTKRPSQLSGGQMQRVAIARALVNDPDILLADEPTGALDSQTSIQVMDILKDLAKERLVIMVTHNRELAREYATRIVELRDGMVVEDSSPDETELVLSDSPTPPKRTFMGFGTALSLSFHNLLTKRGRTLITAFAGSIGIIGIALILAMSTGVNNYIVNTQRETLASYPVTIQQEAFLMDDMAQVFQQAHRKEAEHPLDQIYVDRKIERNMSNFQASLARNNLTAFKVYLEREDSPMKPYLTDVRYDYQTDFAVYAFDPKGEMVQVNGDSYSGRVPEVFSGMMPFSASVLQELTPGDEQGLAGEAIKEKYTLISGHWPQKASDVVLVLDENNELDDTALYQLGILPQEELRNLVQGNPAQGSQVQKIGYQDVLGKKLFMLAAGETYQKYQDGLYRQVKDDYSAMIALVSAAPQLEIVGIVRQDGQSEFSSGGLGYTRALTDLVIKRTLDIPVVKAQQASPDRDVVTGMLFDPSDAMQKATNVRLYLQSLSTAQKAEFARQAYQLIPGLAPEGGAERQEGLSLSRGMNMDSMMAMMEAFSSMAKGAQTEQSADRAGISDALGKLDGLAQYSGGFLADEQVADMLDVYLEAAGDETYAMLYDKLIAGQTGDYQTSLHKLGVVNLETPAGISLYTDTFENKEHITRLIQEYNQQAEEQDQIRYTDYVALMISSVTTIINVISYVLIGFVAVSLVVSSIMIGIITYVSVLERTKEIGILRAVGASRKDVARVFTAEAFIIGLAAGVMGIVLSFLLTLPINAVIHALAKDASVNASLPLAGSLILIVISAFLSLLSGWIPSRVAAKKDPVECLRAE